MQMQATVLRVVDSGLAYVETGDGRQFAFTFDKIAGYRGEYPKELVRYGRKGLRPGVSVSLEIDEKDKVLRVEPA